MMINDLLARIVSGQTLDVDQAVEAFEQIMAATVAPEQVAAMLAMIQLRGPTVSEILGAARVMRAKARVIAVPAGLTVVDTCGTGGDGTGTFNISTAAAIVAAGAGRPAGVVVAKHGNRSVTSRSGSSQALEALGVKLEVTDSVLTDCLEQAGMCFCFAPAHHRAMKHVASVRQSLGFRTLFNILGPLANPAGATRQVVGVYSPELTEPLAHVLLGLGAQQAMVVHGLASQIGGLDELTAVGVNRVSHLCHGEVRTFEIDGQSLGFAASDLGPILVQSPQASAKVIRSVLAGRPGPARDVVCLNAAAALVVAGVAADLAQGVTLAAQAIDGQEAADVLAKLVRITQSH